jgi:general secretion pathway protein A
MYLQFYGLREAPFNPTPDPKFLYQSTRHREALAQLMYGVSERKGFVVLTGEIGTGKTTLLRTLLARLDRDTHVAYVHNTALGIEGLLEYMLHDWNVKSTATTHAQRLLELNEFLIDQHQRGLSPVLIIDEAQNLTVETLEAVRQLSNFETANQKLMQILLVGQPELRTKLYSHELRQLKQRIGLRFHIGPLAPDEVRQYIKHRLRIAGASNSGLFADGAIQRITEYSQGVPRVINIVCDHCLLSGFADDKRRIDAGVVEETIEYLEDGEPSQWRSRSPLRLGSSGGGGTVWLAWLARGGIAALVALLLLLLVFAVNATGWFGHAIP